MARKNRVKSRKDTSRAELLNLTGMDEFFMEGSLTINRKTCRGVECRLCIKSCPTNALFWKLGEIGIIEKLCTYCGACVLSCIVNDCIRITRKRSTGQLESFSNPEDFVRLLHATNAKKRLEKVQDAFNYLTDAYDKEA